MLSEEGGDGTISSSSRRRESMDEARPLGALRLATFFGAADRVEAAFLGAGRVAAFFADAFFGAVFFAAAFLTTAFLVGAFFDAARLGAAFPGAAFFRPLAEAVVAFLAGAGFFFAATCARVDAAVFLRALAGRLAMMESFRNLDSVSISVVLSDAYRKSDGAAEHLLTSRNCGPPDPATQTPALVRLGLGLSEPFVRRQEECARHGKR